MESVVWRRGLPVAAALGLVATLGVVAAAPQRANRRAPDPVTVRLLGLASVNRLFQAIDNRHAELTDGERVAAWSDFSLLVEAVVGRPPVRPFTFEELAAEAGGGPSVAAQPGVDLRDRSAWQMLSVGYSAREVADVVGGRITRAALDNAVRMMVAGLGREAAADYLDGQYTRIAAARAPRVLQPPPFTSNAAFRRSAFDAVIDRYAALHAVEAPVVRAIIEAESAFNPAARSPKGAIGLMQLMPMTARELKVNPLVPEQNIEGGVRYFSQLLQKFGRLDLALVAYNAGPGFAERYSRGQAALYGETREYVRRILTRLGLPVGRNPGR
jgi:soluble lytic murein transglycosylase-like protein